MARHVKIGVLFLWVILSIPGWGDWICAMDVETKRPAPRMGGGPCEYTIYKGIARIISVQKKEMPKGYGGPSHESYEVKFSFFTEEKIQEPHGRVEGREYILKLTNSWYPGPKFLRKYGIEVDRSFDCYLKVITKGTCTPILFDFPAINLSDYFEKGGDV